jgi:hypothetical protein
MMTPNPKRHLAEAFLASAGALLMASGLMLMASGAGGQGGGLPHEPLFQMSLPLFFRLVGGVELAVALGCLFGKRISMQVGLVLWVAASILAYGFSLTESGVKGGFNGYSGIISEEFGVSHRLVNGFLEMTVLYWLLGGLLFTVWGWWADHRQAVPAMVKMACPGCEGHIEFPEEALERKIACPHCQKEITLEKSEIQEIRKLK